MADPTSTANAGPKAKYQLSCSLCRLRKIKCNRVHPCANCVRSGSECVFPSRKRMQRPRKTKNSELLNRISRLETIVGGVNLATLDELEVSEVRGLSELKAQVTANEMPASRPSISESNTAPPAPQQRANSLDSRASKESTHPSRYMGNDFWVNLVGEVEGLKQALAQASDSDTDDESTSASPEALTAPKQQIVAAQGLLVGYPSPEAAGLLHHPSDHHIQFMVQTYFKNVDPILKILHRPTVLKMISDGNTNLTQEQEALQFSIYFAAVTSMMPEDCISHLGQEQMTLFKFYQLEAERAFAAADYLNNGGLECLQGFLLYVACLRVHDDSRASWVLTATLLRLAQAYNLLQDGDGSEFTPYEAEMRRRLWWQVVVLDIRAAEDRGTEAMIDPDGYNTRPPLNVNDDDFGPESTIAPPERTGPSDVTFSLCTGQASSIFLWVGHAQIRFTMSSPHQSEDEIIAKAQALEENFITNHDPTHFQSIQAANLARLVTFKLWLVMQYPLHMHASTAHGPLARWPKVSRETILQTAVSVMELHEHKHNTKEADQFRWWGNTYVQWHPLAVALAELCAQTRGPLVQRAWKIVDVVYPKWALVVADSKRGTLWRPIRKLYKKSKGARTAAMREDAAVEEQTEALQRTELIAEGGTDFSNQLPPQSLLEQQPASTIGDSTISSSSGFRTAMDFTAPTMMSGPMDYEIPTPTPPVFFTDTLTGWPDNINFDMSVDNCVDPMNWAIWNEFIEDTNADGASKTGSSEDG